MLELLMVGGGKGPVLESLLPFKYFRYSNDYLRKLFVKSWGWSDMGNLFEFANWNEGSEQGVRVWRSVVPFTRHDLPATPYRTLPPGETSFVDEESPRGTLYFYMLEVFRTGYESEFTELLTATALATRTGPGPQRLIAGGHTEGFYGTVSPDDFIDGITLADEIGLASGIVQNSTVNWLKFNLDGKTLFVPEKTFRHSISWDNINARGAVFGTRTATIQGDTYKVRLLKGAASDPTSGSGRDPEQSWGSEWNRLMYPLVPNPTNTPTHPASQEGIRYGEWASYTEADLVVGSGNGRATWCQERNGSFRILRGGSGLSNFTLGTPSTADPSYGWRPCLELVQPDDLFLGEVPTSELISGTALASSIGLTAGTTKHSNEPWLCFKLRDGKIIYVAKKTFRHSVSWDQIHARGAVYGDTIVTIKGRRFKVRLLKGANEDPTSVASGTLNPEGTEDSEWNRLFYNIHNGEHTDDNNTTPPGFWSLYSDLDLGIGSVSGNGQRSWCQESSGTNRVNRGFNGLSYFYVHPSSTAAPNMGWRPVLELID